MTKTIQTSCAIAGGGPAGLMLGLHARAGPASPWSCSRSTPISCATSAATPSIPRRMQTMAELGWLDELLAAARTVPAARMVAQFRDRHRRQLAGLPPAPGCEGAASSP